MTYPTPAQSGGLRRTALSAAVAAACMGVCAGANAFEFDTDNDDLSVRWDNTVRYNIGRRVDPQSKAILALPNSDDGDRNFANRSTVTNRVDLLSEFDLVYKKKFGARVSATGWYDQAYSGGFDNTSLATSNHMVNGAPALGLSNYTKRYFKGPSGEWLDAFVFAGFDAGDMPVTVRAGRHAVYWGEALLGGGGIHGNSYGQAPQDIGKAYSVPGTELKELIRPLTQVSGTIQATPELSLAGQYFLKWESYRFPESGSYLGFSDALLNGGESIINSTALPPALQRATRGRDVNPKNSGNWGLAARWSPDWLDGTIGVYYRRFSDMLPQQAVLVAPSGLPAPAPAALPKQYFLTYADGIDMIGFSLSKQIAGISFGADLNYRKNMPLNSDAAIITSLAQLPGQGQTAGARGDTVHGVLNAVALLPASPAWNSASLSTEVTWNRLLSVSQRPDLFKGRANYTGMDKASKDYFGLAINFTPTWYQVFPGADLSMPISWSSGISGNSAVLFGGNKKGGQYSVGLGLDLYSKYRFDLKYVDFFADYKLNPATGLYTAQNGSGTLLRDRGALYLTFKTAF